MRVAVTTKSILGNLRLCLAADFFSAAVGDGDAAGFPLATPDIAVLDCGTAAGRAAPACARAARISGKKRQVHVRTKAETALVFFIASLELCVSHAGGLVQALGRAPGFGRRNPKPNFPTEGGRLR